MICSLQQILALFGMVFIIYLSPTCAMGQGSIDEIEKTEATKAYSLQHLLSQLPPELLLKIFESLDHDWEAIANLSMSCKDCYKISRSPEYINSFKFSSLKLLTQECIDYLFATAAGGSIPQVISRLITVQKEEIAHLTKILTKADSQVMYFAGAFFYEEQLPQDKRKKLLDSMNGHIALAQEEKPYKRIVIIEKMLEEINSAIIQENKGILGRQQDFFVPRRRIFMNFNFSISRLTLLGIEHIKASYQNIIDNMNLPEPYYDDQDLTLVLSTNYLRWLPRQIFELGQLESLDLSNNCLISLPDTLAKHGNSLRLLKLDNYIYRSIPENLIGNNYFESIPPCVLQLKNLHYLCMNNVGMKELDLDQVLQNLPHLSSLKLKRNKILSLSQVKEVFSNRIKVYAAGNPNVYNFRFCKCVSRALEISFAAGLTLFYA